MSRLWYACSAPEKPTDGFVCWHYEGCPDCLILAHANLRRNPTDPHVQWLVDFIETV